MAHSRARHESERSSKMSVKNLAEVDANELKQFLNSFDEVLCDCDGEYGQLVQFIRLLFIAFT